MPMDRRISTRQQSKEPRIEIRVSAASGPVCSAHQCEYRCLFIYPMPLLAVSEIESALAPHRARGERIVSTNGVFDILHVGHARYLFAARELGDLLIVGVNSDASVKRLKGDSRPINPAAERAEMLLALRSVDYCVIFEEDTPVDLLKLIRPAIHAKGGDYDVETMPETPVVRGFGGEIALLGFVEGRSSSRLIEQLANE